MRVTLRRVHAASASSHSWFSLSIRDWNLLGSMEMVRTLNLLHNGSQNSLSRPASLISKAVAAHVCPSWQPSPCIPPWKSGLASARFPAAFVGNVHAGHLECHSHLLAAQSASLASDFLRRQTNAHKEVKIFATSWRQQRVKIRILGARSCATNGGCDSDSSGDTSALDEYVVVNFYHFAKLDDPHADVAKHLSFVEGFDIKGRIYINEQGINAQLSGPRSQAVSYAEWVASDPRFAGVLVQVSPSLGGHTFPRLRLRYKPSLVQVPGGTSQLPLVNASARAVPLSPSEWKRKLAEAADGDGRRANEGAPGGADEREAREERARRVLLLDVRNGYEWDVGHFVGAPRPEVDCFKETEFGTAVSPEDPRDPLAGIDRENTDIMMYCTGGIRCDVYSTMLRERGFKNMYTLEGGVAKYLKEEGNAHWAGNLFVFDGRLAVTPRTYHASTERTPATGNDGEGEKVSLSESYVASCRLCGSPLGEEIRHRNCANADCNELYLACKECVGAFKGCCSNTCENAPRLRPLVSANQYDRWHTYRDADKVGKGSGGGVSQRALNKRRRREQRQLLAALESSKTASGVAI